MDTFNHYILWSQGVSPTEKSIFIKDGIAIDENESSDLFSFITPIEGHWFEAKKAVEAAIKKNGGVDEISPSFKVYFDKNDNILITSHYIDKDNDGRRIVFAFCSRGLDFQLAAQRLEEASKNVGRTCNPNDIHFLDSFILPPQIKTNIRLLILISVLILIVLIIVILYHHSPATVNETPLKEHLENTDSISVKELSLIFPGLFIYV